MWSCMNLLKAVFFITLVLLSHHQYGTLFLTPAHLIFLIAHIAYENDFLEFFSLYFLVTWYPAQRPTNLGDQFYRPLAGGPIKPRASPHMGQSGIDSTLDVFNLRPWNGADLQAPRLDH